MTTWYRLLTAILLLTGVALPACGDENPGDSSAPGPVTRGFYFGATSSYFTAQSGSSPIIDEPDTLFGSRYGGNIGVYANYPLTDLLGLQLDLGYVSKGAQIDEEYDRKGDLIQPAADVRLDYVQFAVLVRLGQPKSRFRDEYNLRPKLLGGFALGTKVKTRTHGLVETYEHIFHDTELSLIFGGGLDYCIWGDRAVTFEFRFDLALTDVYKDWNNSTARFLVGFSL
jgi:hypothetical protein